MEKNRKLKLARLKNKKPEPVVVDMTEVAESINKLAATVETVTKQQERDSEAFSEHLTRLEGIVKGALEKDDTKALKTALENVRFVHNSKPEINIPKIDVPSPQVKIVNTNDDIYDTYKASDSDIGEQNSYYGFIDSGGAWFILRQSGSDRASFRYVFGSKDYRKNWASREKLGYGYYNES